MVFTFALASRLASASAAIARWSCWGNFTSFISTRSTLIPHGSVASSRDSCKVLFNNKYVPVT
uniref:Secreted protein n=1 Tax=Mola mola TaxID=94237 RepID=A0A3Q3VPP1_MOLML